MTCLLEILFGSADIKSTGQGSYNKQTHR